MENTSYKNISQLDLENICNQMKNELSSIGLEHYPFKIGWYNEMVSAEYRLSYNESTLAFVIISTPDMFEKAFIPFIRSDHLINLNNNKSNDPIDNCMKYHLNRLKAKFCNYRLQIIHDFELFMPSRKPKILVQTAAHVSGAAFYYKPTLDKQPNISNRMIGVCMHPEFGGWFAIRGVIIFTDVIIDSLKQKQPLDVIKSEELKNELLYKFNIEWRDWSYRDVIPVSKKYSDLQIKYFTHKPCDRIAFLKENIHFSPVQSSENSDSFTNTCD